MEKRQEREVRDALNTIRERASFAYYSLREGGMSDTLAREVIAEAIDTELDETRDDFESDQTTSTEE
jgi:hypothetical protein